MRCDGACLALDDDLVGLEAIVCSGISMTGGYVSSIMVGEVLPLALGELVMDICS